jgi:mRNA interferase YafQ
MARLAYTARAQKDLSRMLRRGADLEDFIQALELLSAGAGMPEASRDHALEGDWGGTREFHVDDDWLVIYEIDSRSDQVTIVRTGTHRDLF